MNSICKTITAGREIDNFNLKLGRHFLSKPSDDPEHAVVQVSGGAEDVGICAGDFLEIDFTSRSLGEGIFLITMDDEWIGIRFFQRLPELHMKVAGEMHKLSKANLKEIKVIGRVKAVYHKR